MLPATTQLEHFDIHNSYGHLYVQVEQPGHRPARRGEAEHGGVPPAREGDGLRAGAVRGERRRIGGASLGEPGALATGVFAEHVDSALNGITLDATEAGPVRLNLPRELGAVRGGEVPDAVGQVRTVFRARSERRPRPAAALRPAARRPADAAGAGREVPAATAHAAGAVVPELDVRERGHAPQERPASATLEMHPDDAAARGIADGQMVSVFNGRGRFRATAVVGETREAGRGGVARAVVAEVDRRRRELQRDDQHRD